MSPLAENASHQNAAESRTSGCPNLIFHHPPRGVSCSQRGGVSCSQDAAGDQDVRGGADPAGGQDRKDEGGGRGRVRRPQAGGGAGRDCHDDPGKAHRPRVGVAGPHRLAGAPRTPAHPPIRQPRPPTPSSHRICICGPQEEEEAVALGECEEITAAKDFLASAGELLGA